MSKIGKKNNKMTPVRRENGFTTDIEKRGQDKSVGAFDTDVQIEYKNLRVEELTQDVVNNLYYGNDFFKRIVDEIPSDSLKKGFDIKFSPENEALSKTILDMFGSAELDNYLIEFIQMGRKDGFSALLPIIKVNGDLRTDQPLELNRINQILDFNVVQRADVSSIERNNDITKPFYNDIEYVNIKNKNGISIKYHRSWLLIFETGINPFSVGMANQMHLSMYAGLYDGLQTNYNIGWSTGQYAFASFLKVLKMGVQEELNKIRDSNKFDSYRAKKEAEINSSTLAIIGANDTLQSVNLSGNTDFEALQKVNLNDIATRLGIPVSKLMGASAGALASAEQDSDRYIEVIEQYQNVVVKDFLRKVINMLLAVNKKFDMDYQIEFYSIKPRDEKKEAETEKLKSENKKIKAEAMKIKMETLINANKDLNDTSIAEFIKTMADRLKESILEDFELDED